jgi:hypothetical protein
MERHHFAKIVYATFMNEECLLMSTSMSLYNPLEPGRLYPPVFERNYRKEQVKVSLRPLWLPGDWADMGTWFLDEFARGLIPIGQLPVTQLQETFSAMLQCDFAQPFIGLLNDHPGFLVEISEGGKQINDWDEGAHEVEKGDHFIRVILSPAILSMRSLARLILQASLEYFFSHEQVKRIVWELNEKDKHYIHLANRTGFEERRLNDWPGIRIYLYDRHRLTPQPTTPL